MLSSACLTAPPTLPAPCCSGRRPAGWIRPPARRTRHAQVIAAAKAPMTEADLYVSVESSPPVQVPAQPAPWYVVGAGGFVALIAVLRTAKAIARRQGGSLEGRMRGTGVADDAYYSKLMRNMKKVQYEELSDEQIAAARRRRRQDVAEDTLPDLDKIELPENHPFAVNTEVSPEEEELQRLRLSARRGLSSEDMRMLRQQQALAAQMDAEGDARDAQRAAQQQGGQAQS